MKRPAIVLFARSPEREAAAKRMHFAAPLFRAVVAAWLDAARRHGATPAIACAAEDRAALASIAPEIAREWIEQCDGSFGARVAAAADEAFARGFDAVLVAAIDAPPAHLGAALRALASGSAVVAPSHDGGINFIGLVQPEPALLARLTPRRRDLLRIVRAHFETLTIVAGAIDVDDASALDAAHRDNAWRGLLLRKVESQNAICAPIVSRERSPHPSRPPPA